jgi:hypothetical protein
MVITNIKEWYNNRYDKHEKMMNHNNDLSWRDILVACIFNDNLVIIFIKTIYLK